MRTKPLYNRRDFLGVSVAAGVGTLGLSRARAASSSGKLRVLSIGVVGTIGEADRHIVSSHPDAEIVGLCDVDSNYLAKAAADHPDAFTCKDYREAFEKHVDKFDAVIVSVPDHSHAPILLTAMLHHKHVYGQKPLVHQLAELVMVEQALKARPKLVTQLGNQRMSNPARRAAVEILRQGMLGKAITAYSWVGSPNDSLYFNFHKKFQKNPNIPANLDYNLWLGPNEEIDYYDNLAPAKWRSWWDFGTNGLGDWGCHTLDVFFFAYDDLMTPVSVKTDCAEPAGKWFHTAPCKSVITYQVNNPSVFADRTFKIHFNDSNVAPPYKEMGLPGPVNNYNMSVVVCEKGTLVLEADGNIKVWQDGKEMQGLRMPGLPKKWQPLNHWHAWVDNCLGREAELCAPFKDAIRITEPCLLAVKATRFPGQELKWDRSKLAFTNNPEATKTLVRRKYREGFAPPQVS